MASAVPVVESRQCQCEQQRIHKRRRTGCRRISPRSRRPRWQHNEWLLRKQRWERWQHHFVRCRDSQWQQPRDSPGLRGKRFRGGGFGLGRCRRRPRRLRSTRPCPWSIAGGGVYVSGSVRGARGGSANGSGRGGNGAPAHLSNAVSGDTTGELQLMQHAIGGNGGNSGTGLPGTGGNASSSYIVKSSDSSYLSLDLKATGGNGGSRGLGAGSGAAGGAAVLTADVSGVPGGVGIFGSVGGGEGGSGSQGANGGNPGRRDRDG